MGDLQLRHDQSGLGGIRVLIAGGTGEVGTAVVRALVAEPTCNEVVMVNRRALSSSPAAAFGR